MWWLGTVRANWEQVFRPAYTWTWFRESFPHHSPLIPHGNWDDELSVSPDWVDEG